MERVTLRVPKPQLEEIEARVDAGEYPNRSEAIRAAVRKLLNESKGPREGHYGNGAHGNTGKTDERRPWSKV